MSDVKSQILIVEDDVFLAYDMEALLVSAGYEIIGIEHSGEEAVRRALAEKPDLILMDIRLDGTVDGVEAAVEIRKQADIPVLFCTAHSGKGIETRGEAASPAGWLIKPYSPDQLIRAVASALGRDKS